MIKNKMQITLLVITSVFFLILSIIGIILLLLKKVDNFGYAVLPMVIVFFIIGFYRKSKLDSK